MQTWSALYLVHQCFVAEHQDVSSQSRRALVVTTATAWRCIPWRSAPRLSTTTCSVDWARGVMSAPLDVAEGDQETGVSANRPSRTGIDDLTGTAPRARKETCQMWRQGPPSLRWRCGNRKGEPLLRCSSQPLLILTTPGQGIVLMQVMVFLQTHSDRSNNHFRPPPPITTTNNYVISSNTRRLHRIILYSPMLWNNSWRQKIQMNIWVPLVSHSCYYISQKSCGSFSRLQAIIVILVNMRPF